MQLFDLFNFENSPNIESANQTQAPGLITFPKMIIFE